MDQHLHERTNCPACLRIPEWQIDILTFDEEFCDRHHYWARHKSDDEFTEYHDGQEIADSWGWDIDWEIDREAGLDIHPDWRYAMLDEQIEIERNYALFPDLYLPDCKWCGGMHVSSGCPDKWLIYPSPFDEQDF